MSNIGPISVFATNSGKVLAEKICALLSLPLGKAKIEKFNDGEINVKIEDSVRGDDVFIVTDIHGSADNLMEAIFLADAARMSSAGRVTFIITKFGQDRSDRKDEPRKPIGVKLVIKMLECALPNRVIVLDIHSEQSMAIFTTPVCDHLFGSAIAIRYLPDILKQESFVVGAPDQGGVPRARKYARLLGQEEIVFFSKERVSAGEVKNGSIRILGDVLGKIVLLVDDMIDTGGTVIADAEAAKRAGATKVYVFATHAIFSKDAIERIMRSEIDRVFVTDSIYHDPEKLEAGKITILSSAPLLADAIRRTHDNQSLTGLIPS